MREILGYSLVEDKGDGESCVHYYKTLEAAQAHYDWVWAEFGYGAEEPSAVTPSDFEDEFVKPW
jgi:hypothetical protein